MTNTQHRHRQDLWALYDWLIPGLLGDRKGFAQRFRTPVEREGDAHAQAALNARTRPFLPRRTKSGVATELPDRAEIADLVPLGERRRALHETTRLAMDRRVQDAIAARAGLLVVPTGPLKGFRRRHGGTDRRATVIYAVDEERASMRIHLVAFGGQNWSARAAGRPAARSER